MLTVAVLKRNGCVVSSDAPVTVAIGEPFQIYRMNGATQLIVGTGTVHKLMGPTQFKLHPQQRGPFPGVLVGDLVQAVVR